MIGLFFNLDYNTENGTNPLAMGSMNRYFLLWYYTEGLRSSVQLAENLLRFTAHRFSLLRLLTTLFSPWKRDVTFHTWRGLHPIRSLGALSENILSRFLGMLVRLFVIGIGIGVLFLTFFLGVFLLALYISAPFGVIFGSLLLPFSPFFGVWMLAIGIGGLVLVFIGYLLRQRKEPLSFDVTVLYRKRWFPRVLGRLGLIPGSFDKRLLESTEAFLSFLKTLGIERDIFERAVRIEKEALDRRDRKRRFWLWENFSKKPPIGKGWRYAYTPHLDDYCIDLSAYDFTEYGSAELIGRSDEFKVATLVLERPTQNSVLLVGDPGIGKKTFIHHLARRIRENMLSGTSLCDARILLFDIGRAMSEATNEGDDIDNRIRHLLHEATYAGNVIVVIENLDLYLGGDASRHNIAPVLVNFLGLPAFRMIGTAPTGRYHSFAKSDEQALKFLETIYLRETTPEETFTILLQHFDDAERKRVVFTLKGIESVITSAGRYNWEWPFPERAIDLAQETLLYWRDTAEDFITSQTVDAFIEMKTGVPTGEIDATEKEKLLKLEQYLHERVIGQDEAVRQVAEAMRKARAGFGNGKRPLGSFIFFGPSGVGKTETVKAFAESYFGSEDKMIRLDMSEYQTGESVARMIGSRDTNVRGQLTSAVKEKPFSIVLLDEIEKAYPRVLDLFLQILDEGYVTDAFGEKINFRNTVIIATSNAGSAIIKELVEKHTAPETIRKQVLDSVVKENLFRLEFLGRFDGLIFFEPLQPGELEKVTRLKLDQFAVRLKEEKNITISFASDVPQRIVEKGFEPEFGTRSINRYIENTIEDAIVKKIISGEVASGGTLMVSGNDL